MGSLVAAAIGSKRVQVGHDKMITHDGGIFWDIDGTKIQSKKKRRDG